MSFKGPRSPSLLEGAAIGRPGGGALSAPAPPRTGVSARDPASRRTPAIAIGIGVVLVAVSLLLLIEASAGKSPLLPPSPSMTKWLEGLGSELTFRIFLIGLLVFTAAYAGLLAYARHISARVAIAVVAAVNVIIFIAPVLISTDVFSYIAYARMAVMHGINPYTHGPAAIQQDPIFNYVGTDWLKATTAYGPIYTLLSYPIAPLGLIASVWGMKVEALAGSAAAMALTWRCAKQRGMDPVVALIAVGANPLWVLYGFGGDHNDLIMIAFMMGAVTLTLAGSDLKAGATLAVDMFVKATAVVMLPFMVIGRRRVSQIAGLAIGAAVCAALGYVLFGVNGADIFSVLTKDSSYVSTDGFPTELAHLIGWPGIYPVDHTILKGLLIAIVAYLLWRTWRGYDWLAASGWALLAVAVTSPWRLAWYTLWGLPLSVITRDRRLLYAILAVQGLFIIHQTSPMFAPVT